MAVLCRRVPSQVSSPLSITLQEQLQSALGSAYAIERELGGGGMSHVFLATESALGRRVVIKVLPPETAGSISVERFKREIGLAARLQHAHIVPLLTAGEAAGLPYFTMPYVEGENLRARVARGGELPLRDAMRVLREVASALAYAHEHGIVHRDIKPDNVLIASDSAMVTDFGVAKAVSAAVSDEQSGLTSLGVALGTPAYMAPEQATADPMVDHRADIYAFGCLAYEVLTGQAPFAGRPGPALLAAQVREIPEAIDRRRPSLPPSLAALVMRCLEKRPADRPQQASDVVKALDDIVTPSGGSPPTARFASTESAAPAMARRKLIVGVSVAIAAVAAFVVFQLSRAGARSNTPASAPASLAVLPLTTGGDTANEFFAQGMTEELTSALTKVEGLGVVSRTLAAATVRKNPDADVRAVGRMLNVATVLEGTVRRAQDRLRVTAQLTNVADGRLLWSESYQGSGTDVFTVQDSVARSIVTALRGAIAARGARPIRVAGTRDARAHELVQRARYNFANRTELPGALAMLREALARDAQYAEAHALMASVYAVLDDWTTASLDTTISRAVQYARQALAIDSTLADAHAAMGNALVDAGQFEAAMQSYEKSIALNPNHAPSHHWRGILLAAMGKSDEAFAEFSLAHALDPLAPNIHGWYAAALMQAGRTDESIREYNLLRATSPTFLIALSSLASIHLDQGRRGLAAAYADSASSGVRSSAASAVNDLVRGAAGSVYAQLGRTADARRLLAEIRAGGRTKGAYAAPGEAQIQMALGFPDSAFATLERHRDELSGTAFGVMGMGLPWGFHELSKDPRLVSLLARRGLRR